LLITVDCFRADHAGFLGYRRSTTPFLDSMAKESLVFSNAIVAGDVSGRSPGNGSECRILRVSCDFRNVDVVLSGHQQAPAVALVPTPDGLYFSSDTPLEPNHVYRLDREGEALLTRSRRSELAGASCHDRSVLLGRRSDFDGLVFYPLLLNLTFFGCALPGNGISFTSGGHTDLRRGANHGSNE
jgi:hypothetical protein